jgi:predicted Zn-dependent protease
VAAALTAASGVVYVTHLEPVPLTGRSHLILCSHDTELQLGRQAAAAVLADVGPRAVLPPSSPAARRVARVAARLVTALREDERLRKVPHLATQPWRFTVIASPQINAFVVPGGDAFVFTGLLDAFPDDDSLAMVLAHEMARRVRYALHTPSVLARSHTRCLVRRRTSWRATPPRRCPPARCSRCSKWRWPR